MKNKISIGSSITKTILVLVFFVLELYIIISSGHSFDFVCFLFMVNMFIFFATLFSDDRKISLNKVYSYFMIIFMSVAPLCNYCYSYYPWNFIIKKRYFICANLMIIVWSCIYLVSYRRFNKKMKKQSKDDGKKTYIPYCLFFILSLLCFLVLIFTVGISNLLSRSNNSLSIDSTYALVYDFILRFTPVITLFLFIRKRRKTYIEIVGIVVLLFITLISNYPVSNSRYNTAAVIFVLILSISTQKDQNKNRFLIDYSILVGLLVLFPLMYSFKNKTLNEVWHSGIKINVVKSFNTIDFDAFSFVARGALYVEENGVEFGKQILSTIFFFVPRSVLPIKGEISGALIVNSQSPGAFNNVSCPLVVEAFLDFGYIGIIIYPIIVAYLFVKLDCKKDDIINLQIGNDYFLAAYSLILGFIIYIMRGSLAPTFLRLMGTLLVVFLFVIISKILSLFSNKKEQ